MSRKQTDEIIFSCILNLCHFMQPRLDSRQIFYINFVSKYIFLTICNIFSAELLRNWLYCTILHYCIAVVCSIVSSGSILINFHESFIYNSGHTFLHILDLLTILFMCKLKAPCIKITYCDSILELNFH